MKTPFKLAGFALASAFSFPPSTLFGQGSLTPPGAPAPTMKTLDQIEARTAISSAPFTINQPGSYYLTTNITVGSSNAVTIASHGVTLDFNGHTISSTAASATGYGVRINSGLKDVTILNGHIVSGVTNNAGTYNGSGFQYGISFFTAGTAPINARVTGVSVSGCLSHGIYLGAIESSVVESCTVRTVGANGIVASAVKQSSAIDCGSHAIGGNQVTDCRGQSIGGDGIIAATAQNCLGSSSGSGGTGVNASTALNCYGSSSTYYGVLAETTQNCYGSSSSGTGVRATTAQNCRGISSGGGDGVHAFIASGCYGSSVSGYGVYVDSVASLCYGSSSAANSGMRAWIANSCDGNSFTVFNKYNMP
jgi:hypothetical protein